MVISGTESPPTCCSNFQRGSQSAEEEERRRSLKKDKVRGCTQGKFKKNKDYFKLRIMERFSGKELKNGSGN